MTDREMLLQWKADQQADRAVEDMTDQQALLGAGLAVFCETFLEGLRQGELTQALTPREQVRLLVAALGGR